MATDRQREANRRNAQKSTGPRTEAGKARSRQNALKHGLTGSGAVLPPEDAALFQQRLAEWTEDARPEGPMEEYLVACAALASVRIDRCARNEFSAVARLRREAQRRWQDAQIELAERRAARLATQPAKAVRALRRTVAGCAWLLARWYELAGALAGSGCWTAEQEDLALRLLGADPAAPAADDTPLGGVRTESDRARRAPSPDSPACAALRALTDGCTAELTRRRERLWIKRDGPALAEAIDLATLDTSPEGALRHRYATASQNDLLRVLAHFGRLQDKARPGGASGRDTSPPQAAISSLNAAPARETKPFPAPETSSETKPIAAPEPSPESKPIPEPSPDSETKPIPRPQPATPFPGALRNEPNPPAAFGPVGPDSHGSAPPLHGPPGAPWSPARSPGATPS